MTTPLSLFLTRFSAPPPFVAMDIEPAAPTVTLRQAELDARIETAAREARLDADRRHAADVATIAAANEAALAEALGRARAEWVEAEGVRLAALFDARFAELRTMIDDGVASVLRPLLADAVRVATTQAVMDALDRLLADPAKPAVSVRGPADLLEVLRETRPDAGIEWVAAETVDVAVTAEATQIHTRLAAALSAIAATES